MNDGDEMATGSLYRDLILDTPKAARNMETAFERAEKGDNNIPYRESRLRRDAEFLDSIIDRQDHRWDTISYPSGTRSTDARSAMEISIACPRIPVRSHALGTQIWRPSSMREPSPTRRRTSPGSIAVSDDRSILGYFSLNLR